MKRRTVLRKAVVGGLVASGAASAVAAADTSPDANYVMEKQDGDWLFAGTTDGQVGTDATDCTVTCCQDCDDICGGWSCTCEKLCEFP